MNISVTAPFKSAWNHMVRILFKPFDIKKWFVLGFCAFLAQCGEGGGSGNTGNWNQSGGTSFQETADNIETWITANWALFLSIAIGSVLFILIINLLVTWLSSRGKFMLLDGVVKNRGAVVEPWSEYKTEGNSLFIFRFIISIIVMISFMLILGISAYFAYPDFQAETWETGATNAIILLVGLGVPLAIICIAFKFFLGGFVIPTMYLRRVRVMEGMQLAWNHICKGHMGSAVLLFFMMFLLGIGVAIIAVVVTCATCCIAALPYISAVVFLPITVFFTCYFLAYIEQFGNDWKFFTPVCDSCGYDKQGHAVDAKCPECGK